MDNYKKINCFLILAIFSLAFSAISLRDIHLFNYGILRFNYNFLGFETGIELDSLFIFNHISKLALPIAAYLLVVNINQIKNFKKVAIYMGALALFTQVLILFIRTYMSPDLPANLFSPHVPFVRFFRGGNFFHIFFFGTLSIATYEKLKTKQRQAYAFIPFAITFIVFVILNKLPVFYPSLGLGFNEEVRVGNILYSNSLYVYVVELLTLPLFIVGITLTSLLINRLPDIDITQDKKRNKLWSIFMPALIIFMYSNVWPVTPMYLGYALILCLHIAIKNDFGHIKTLIIIMSVHYSMETFLIFAFAPLEAIPFLVTHFLLLTAPSIFFSMLSILLIHVFNISDEQVETNYITNILSSSIYPITILSIYLIFII